MYVFLLYVVGLLEELIDCESEKRLKASVGMEGNNDGQCILF
jgi:hypothetical protein